MSFLKIFCQSLGDNLEIIGKAQSLLKRKFGHESKFAYDSFSKVQPEINKSENWKSSVRNLDPNLA